MSNTLTITEHEKIKVEEERNIPQRVISKKDKALLLEVTHKNRLGQIVNVFHSYKDTIQAKSIVGSISIKSGLIIEILPKFAKDELTEESKKNHRKILLNMIRVSKEKNFISSTIQSSKTSVGEMPLIRYMIELFSESLLITLRNSTFSNYSKTITNSSYIKGNLLVSKTIQNNIIDKSKVYVSYNRHSMDNLLMQIFRTLAKILLNDTNLSYIAKQNLYEVYLLLDNVEIINIKQHDFSKITFNRLNHNFEYLFRQAEFIFNQYMPFTSNINSTPFWAILFNMDYLFEKFCAYLFRRSNIEIEEQTKIDCFGNGIEMVRMKSDFILSKNDKKISVVDAKWKLLSKDKDLYGLNTQNFWQLFSYMNLTDSAEELNGYFIVPKYGDDFEDEIVFKPIKEGFKAIIILSIDFSLDFEDLIDKYKFKIVGNELKLNTLDIKKEITHKEKEPSCKDTIIENKKFKFDFEGFIKELEILYHNKNIRKRLSTTKKDEKFKNLYYLKERHSANSKVFKNAVKENISKLSWNFTDLEIDTIPSNILKLKNIHFLDLSNNQIRDIPIELFRLKKLIVLDISQNNIKFLPKSFFELKNLRKLIIDKVIVEDNMELLKELKEKGIEIKDNQGNDLIKNIIFKENKKTKNKNKEKILEKTSLITTANQYSKATKEEKINFVSDNDFSSTSLEIIELIMKETDIDILEDFTYNKTLPLRFAFATYNNNLEREENEVARLRENLIKRNIKILQQIIGWSINRQENYVKNNITNIDSEIILGYSLTTLPRFKNIKEKIIALNKKSKEISKKEKEDNFNEYYDLAVEAFENKDFKDALEFLKEYKVSTYKKEILKNNIYKEIGQPFNKVKKELLDIKKKFDAENRIDIKKYIKNIQLKEYPILNFLTRELSIQDINQLTFILTYINNSYDIDNKFIKTINQLFQIIENNLINISEEQNEILDSNVLAWKDLETGLIWEVKNDYNINQVLSWKQSFDYAKKLNSNNYANYNDWRVPTINELKTLNTSNINNNHYIKKPLSKNITKDIYWSNTEYKRNRKKSVIYITNFKYSKNNDEYYAYRAYNHSIRCVRN